MLAFWEILRPFNCLMASAAAIIGLLIAMVQDMHAALIIAGAVFLITGAGNVINDYYDRQIDAINRPDRPIPSKRVRPQTAFYYSIALFAAGCILAGLAGRICLAIAAFNSLLLFFYARNLKATPILGNLSVSYLTGSTFLFGGAVAGFMGILANQVPLVPFWPSTSREIAKDIEDMVGDQQGGARTLPILAGERAAAALAGLFGVAGVALSLLAPFGRLYLLIVAVADLLLLLSVYKVIRKDAAGSQKAIKKGMAVALLAFLAGALLS